MAAFRVWRRNRRWRERRDGFARRTSVASGRFRRRGGSFGNAAAGWAERRDKTWVLRPVPAKARTAAAAWVDFLAAMRPKRSRTSETTPMAEQFSPKNGWKIGGWGFF